MTTNPSEAARISEKDVYLGQFEVCAVVEKVLDGERIDPAHPYTNPMIRNLYERLVKHLDSFALAAVDRAVRGERERASLVLAWYCDSFVQIRKMAREEKPDGHRIALWCNDTLSGPTEAGLVELAAKRAVKANVEPRPEPAGGEIDRANPAPLKRRVRIVGSGTYSGWRGLLVGTRKDWPIHPNTVMLDGTTTTFQFSDFEIEDENPAPVKDAKAGDRTTRALTEAADGMGEIAAALRGEATKAAGEGSPAPTTTRGSEPLDVSDIAAIVSRAFTSDERERIHYAACLRIARAVVARVGVGKP